MPGMLAIASSLFTNTPTVLASSEMSGDSICAILSNSISHLKKIYITQKNKEICYYHSLTQLNQWRKFLSNFNSHLNHLN
uniref:Uncharacterized protein n=1 Tax=Arion vulgaris TaxID=1028688 RepID=A0A0B7B6Q9_9EUPU